jgi:hypothetical protein
MTQIIRALKLGFLGGKARSRFGDEFGPRGESFPSALSV